MQFSKVMNREQELPIILEILSKQTFSCSKLAIEAKKQGVKYFQGKHKDNRATSVLQF